MILLPTLLAAAGMLLSSAQQDLPSAPSAVLQQQQQRPAQPPSPPPPVAASPSSTAVLNQAAPQSQSQSVPEQKASDAPGTPKAESAGANSEADANITIVKRVDEVSVIFTVTDKHGKFVKNLTKDDFDIRDDNLPPKQVNSFSRETNLPLRVGLLIDASNSIRDRFKFEQEAAAEFLGQVIRPQSDLAFVIGFDTTTEVTADFTDNAEKLTQGVRRLRPGGGTAMFDAVYFACRDKLMKAPQKGPARRAIVLISDGDDNQSRVTREEAIEMALRAEVIIYTISTNSSGYREKGDKILERMAEATGGRAFFPFKIEDVGNALSEIQEELRSQYAVSYRPANFNPDGRFHSIEILPTAAHKNLKVRARRGYYAPRQ